MSDDTLELIIKKAIGQSDKYISFGWQGGEPTLMGLPFFKKAVEFQKKYNQGKTISNGLQTNGILIDWDWAKFLVQNKFLIGLSIDGPEYLHNHYRLMRDGNKSWKKVRDKAVLLLDNGVDVNALSVISDYSSEFPEEIYDFHKNLGLTYMQFIPCLEINSENPDATASFSVSAEKLGTFLCKIFDLWLQDFANGSPTTSIRFFESIFFRYVGMEPPDCSLLDECGTYLVIEHNGDIYPCDFFVQQNWKLGNINDVNLKEMLNSNMQMKFRKMKSSLAESCSSCKWFNYCRGGCIREYINMRNDKKINYFCDGYKVFFEHAHSHFQRIAFQWKTDGPGGDAVELPKRYKPKRNDPCPCGSGLKYKKCCGKIQ